MVDSLSRRVLNNYAVTKEATKGTSRNSTTHIREESIMKPTEK